MDYLFLLIVSFLSNLFSAFSGGGAGIIQLPAILLLFEISFPVALATHKISTVLLGIGASLKFFEKNSPNKKFIKDSGVVKVIIGSPIYKNCAKEATREAYKWINSKFSEIH